MEANTPTGALRSNHSKINASRGDVVYIAFATVVALLLTLSPIVRRFTDFRDFDRALDVLCFLLITVRACEIGPRLLAHRGFIILASIIAYFSALCIYNYFDAERFQWKLVFIECKSFFFFAAVLLLSGRRLSNERVARKLLFITYAAFLLATLAFIFFPSKDRLSLLNESNYTMLAMTLIAAAILNAFRPKIGSALWVLVLIPLLIAAGVAHSRTGFFMVACLLLQQIWSTRNIALFVISTAAATLMLTLGFNAIVEMLARGQRSIYDVDRFIFLNEYVAQLRAEAGWRLLFNNAIGTYFSERPLYMDWWVAKLCMDQRIPYGLAPFHFHSEYLRMAALVGILPSVVIFTLIFGFLQRALPGAGVLLFLLAATSMSVFHLSSVLPFLIIALITTGPKAALSLDKVSPPTNQPLRV